MSGDEAGESHDDSGAEPGTGTAAHQGVAAAGQRLRSEREARGLSLTEVSTQLHLDPRLVSALEAGEDHQLPGATYITGYVRAYARLLRLDEDELAAMAGSSVAPRSELLPENVDLGRPRRGASLGGWLVVALLVVAGGAGWWWFQSRPASEDLLPATSRDALPATDAPAAPAAMAPQTTEAPALPAAGPRAATEDPLATPSPAATPAPPASVPLELRFTDDSWLEVTDASGTVLAWAMMEAGSQVELQGIPPFEVLLGYAPGVAITYNGQPFDTAPFIRGDVARLRIGDATP